MKRVSWAGVVLALWAGTADAQTFPLGQPLTAVWEGAANEVDAAIDRYEVQVDAGAWTATGQTVPQAEYRYAIPQALLTVGDHTVAVRGCSAAACLDSASVSITVTRPLPGLPRNLRVVPVPNQAALSVPQAIDRAQAYALLILDRALTPGELNYLAQQHGPQTPTRETVLTVLDAAFAPLVIQPQ